MEKTLDDQSVDALDSQQQNEKMYSVVTDFIGKQFPIETANRVLELKSILIDEEKTSDLDIPAQKKAKLESNTWAVPIFGHFILRDKNTGEIINETPKLKIMNMPKITQRFSMIIDGNEYQTVNQMRLKSGIYARMKNNGDYESQFNLAKGFNFKLTINPQKGVFSVGLANQHYRLYSLLKALGTSDQEMLSAWGERLYKINSEAGDESDTWYDLVEKLMHYRPKTTEEARAALIKYFEDTEVDPTTTNITLGKPYSTVQANTWLAASKKLLKVQRGESPADERDSLVFKSLMTPDNLLGFYLDKKTKQIEGNLKFRTEKKDKVRDILSSDTYGKVVKSFFTVGDLSATPAQTNPASILAEWRKTTVMGAGGVPSMHSVTMDTRNVHPSQINYLDPVATPDGAKVGINLALSLYAEKNKDGEMVSPVIGKDGKVKMITPSELWNKKIGFGGEYQLNQFGKPVPKKETVMGTYKGKPTTFDRDTIDGYVLKPQGMFSWSTNLIPFMENTQGNRALMASKNVNQAFTIDNNEAPLVQAKMPLSPRTFDQAIGSYLNPYVPKTIGESVVTGIDEDYIYLKDKAAGEEHKIGLYNKFPMNQESYIQSTPTVKVGDTVKSGQELARNNFEGIGIDGQKSLGLGANVQIAYMPYKGLSVSGDSMVYWSDKDEIGHYTKIKDIPENEKVKSNILDNKDFTTYLHEPHSIIAHKLYEPMLKITTNDGEIVKLTQSHSLITIDDDGNLSKIEPKNVIVGKTLVPIVQPKVNFGTITSPLQLATQSGRGKEVTIPLNKDLGFILGMYVAEGCTVGTNNKTVSIAVTNPTLLDKVKNICNSWGITVTPNIRRLDIFSSALGNFLFHNAGKGAYKKRVPDIIWSAPKEVAEGFIDGYWSGDGTVTKEVTASTTSKELADGVCFLLAVLGIRATSRVYRTTHHDENRIKVFSYAINNFPTLTHPDKQRKIEKLQGMVRKWSYDRIPIPKKYINEVKKVILRRNDIIDGYVSRELLLPIFNSLPKRIQELVSAPVWWDFIKSVEKCDEKEAVYDFDMRPYGNFIVGGGLCVKNTFEDGYVATESFAKKFSHSVLHNFSAYRSVKGLYNKGKLAAEYPEVFANKGSYDKLGTDGIVKEGVTVKKGDVLIAHIEPRDFSDEQKVLRNMNRSIARSYDNHAVLYEFDEPGVVTYVNTLGRKTTVRVKVTHPLVEGDKLTNRFGGKGICYSDDTEILTAAGWKLFKNLTKTDTVCTRDEVGNLEYQTPTKYYNYHYSGEMYKLHNSRINLLTTPDHNLYVRNVKDDKFKLVSSKDCFGKIKVHTKKGIWDGEETKTVTIPGMAAKINCHKKNEADLILNADDFLEFFGYYITEGCLSHSSQITIGQRKEKNPENYEKIKQVLVRMGFTVGETPDSLTIYDKRLHAYLSMFGKSKEKYIPRDLLNLSTRQLTILLDACVLGDGCVFYKKSTNSWMRELYTSSEQLANDYQELALKTGVTATVRSRYYKGSTEYKVHFSNNLEVYTGEDKRYKNKKESWINYSGEVYCVEVPNHVIYVRREGTPIFCGNCVKIIPDDEAPHTAAGKRIDLIMSPFGIPSRMNPSQLLEVAAAKIAEKTGKPYIMENFTGANHVDNLIKELKDNNIEADEVVLDGKNGKPLDGKVFTGPEYIMKLMHVVEHKEKSRSYGSYNINEAPGRGSSGGQSADPMLTYAMLANGAKANLRDFSTIKSQKNDELWRALQLGQPLPSPEKPFVFEKMMNYMRAAGVDHVKQGDTIQLLPMTDKKVLELSNGKLDNAGNMLVGKNLSAIAGGLFDAKLTGGNGGKQWTHMELDERIPSPLFAKPIQSLLGINKPEYDKRLSTDMAGVVKDLEKIDVEKEYNEAKTALKVAPESKVNALNKKVRFLATLKDNNLSPADAYTIKNLPILPPVYRPIYPMPSGDLMTSPINNHYRAVSMINDGLKKDKANLVEGNKLNEVRKALYDNIGELQGLTDLTHYGKEKYEGLLKTLAGTEPKEGFVQNNVWSKRQDLSARSTITLEPSLGVDEVGLPTNVTKDIYGPFAVQKLVSLGYNPLEAKKEVKDGTPTGLRGLDLAMEERPVLLNRAPTLHKHGIQAFRPKRVDGQSIRLNPLIVGGFNADFDGNSYVQYLQILINIKKLPFYYKLINNLNGDLTLDKIMCILKEEGINVETLDNLPFEEHVAVKSKGIRMFGEILLQMIEQGKETQFNTIHISQFPHLKDTGVKTKNGNMEYDVPEGIHVMSYKDGAVQALPVSKFSVHNNLNLVRVNTLSKRSIVCSEDRSLFCFNPETGVLERMAPKDSKGRLLIKPAVLEFDKKWEIPGSKEEGYFIGCIVGDGWADHSGSNTNAVIISTDDRQKPFKNFYKNVVRKLVGDSSVKFSESENTHMFDGCVCRSGKLIFRDKKLANYIRNNLGKGAFNKQLPTDWLFKSRDWKLGALSGLLETDGTICKVKAAAKKNPQYQVAYATVSTQLSYDVHLLCASLGMRTSVSHWINKAGNETHTISISIVDLLKIRDELWIYHANKKEALMEASVSKDDRDLIPVKFSTAGLLTKFIDFKKEGGLYAALSYVKKRGKTTRETVIRALANFDNIKSLYEKCLKFENIEDAEYYKKYLEKFKELTVEDLADIEVLRSFAINDKIFWEEIKEILPVTTDKSATAWDITVPGSYTFMSANGLILYDTMSAFVPTSQKAVSEAYGMLPSKNLYQYGPHIDKPKMPIVDSFSQIYQQGLWYLTREVGEYTGQVFKDIESAAKALEAGAITETTPINITGIGRTTYGKELVLSVLPDELKDRSLVFDSKTVEKIMSTISIKYKNMFGQVMNHFKNLGNRYSYQKPITLSITDLAIDRSDREAIMSLAHKKADQLTDNNERAAIFNKASLDVRDALYSKAKEKGNRFFDMLDSGAQGKPDSIRQVLTMPGVLNDVHGNPIRQPVETSWSEGVPDHAYWNHLYAARKGTIDRAVNTQDSGALNKALLTNLKDLLITEHDCKTTDGIGFPANDKNVMGRVSLVKVDGVISPGQIITPAIASMLAQKLKDKEITVRSPLTCETVHGVCATCYGLTPDGNLPRIGENVGVLDAQSITERSCNHSKTITYVKIDNVLHVLSLEKLYNKLNDLYPSTVIGDTEVIELESKNVFIFDGSIFTKVNRIGRHAPTDDMMLIKTNEGAYTICQANHPMPIFKGKNICTHCGKKLYKSHVHPRTKTGNSKCTYCGKMAGNVYSMPEYEKVPTKLTSRDIKEFIDYAKQGNVVNSIRNTGSYRDLPLTDYWFGFYLAEGCIHYGKSRAGEPIIKGISICQNEDTDISNIITDNEKHNWKISNHARMTRYNINSKLLGEEFERKFGRYSHNKQLPDDFINYSDNKLLRIVAGIIDGDGYFDNQKHHFVVSTNSFYLVQQLSLIASFLKIKTELQADFDNGIMGHQGFKLALKFTQENIDYLKEYSFKIKNNYNIIKTYPTFESGNYAFIDKIKKIKYEEPFVYDVETESHLCQVGTYVTHNTQLTMNCAHKDGLLEYQLNDTTEMCTHEELWNKLPGTVNILGDIETKPVPLGLKLRNAGNTWVNVLSIERHKPQNKMVMIKTKDGNAHIVQESHPVATYTNKLSIKAIKDIKLNEDCLRTDYRAITHNTPTSITGMETVSWKLAQKMFLSTKKLGIKATLDTWAKDGKQLFTLTIPGGKEHASEFTEIVCIEPIIYNDYTYDYHVEGELYLINSMVYKNSFHSGGSSLVAGGITGGFPELQSTLEVPDTVPGKATLATSSGTVTRVAASPAGGFLVSINGIEHGVGPGRKLLVRTGSIVTKGQPLSSGTEKPQEVLALRGYLDTQRGLVDRMDKVYDSKFAKRTFETAVRGLSNNAVIKKAPDDFHMVRGDTAKYSYLKAENKKRAAEGLEQIEYEPYLKSIQVLPHEKDDWLSRMTSNNIKRIIQESAARGSKTNIHGYDPHPAYLYGHEFGEKFDPENGVFW